MVSKANGGEKLWWTEGLSKGWARKVSNAIGREKRWLRKTLNKDCARIGFDNYWLREALVEESFEHSLCEEGFSRMTG